jgi:hypothetical protein
VTDPQTDRPGRPRETSPDRHSCHRRRGLQPSHWADETGTLARLKSHQTELIELKITEPRGRIVKLTGDGMLAEFPSVVNAVACAAGIQRGMRQRNEAVPRDRWIELRIGVHLGGVIVRDGDIFVDGVNVAARFEGIVASGEIAVSSRIWCEDPQLQGRSLRQSERDPSERRYHF